MQVTADVQAKVIELQAAIMAAPSDAMGAQAAQMELLERIRNLENELKGFEDWEAEKKRYQMARVGHGVTVYLPKQETMEPGEVMHALCANCFQTRRKTFLQLLNRAQGHTCSVCRTILPFWDLSPAKA
jgi:hypothetical protein